MVEKLSLRKYKDSKMFYLSGLFISACVLALASYFLDQHPAQFLDSVAVVVVGGGTLAVIISTKPPYPMKVIKNLLIMALKKESQRNSIIKKCTDYLTRKVLPTNPVTLDEQILVNGNDLLMLGFPRSEVEKILTLKTQVYADTSIGISQWVKSLAKYPPAFGLAGTVLGLIHLMRSLSESSSPAQTGTLMSIALLATLYGIVLSNFIISPLGERVKLVVDEEIVNSEIAIQTVLMAFDKTNLLVAQENLDQYLVLNQEKIDLIGGNEAEFV
jgi:chemotaxis protein MotA